MADPNVPPAAPTRSLRRLVKCPSCGSSRKSEVDFTWWGGLLGPMLFHLVRCRHCRKLYDGRTGTSATGRIVVYCLIAIALGTVLSIAWFSRR